MEATGKDAPVPTSIFSVPFARSLFTRLGADRTFSLAADMAFWLFLSLLPLAAVAGLVVAKLFATERAVGLALLDTLPPVDASPPALRGSTDSTTVAA